MLTPDEVREIANRVLGETLGPAGFVSADVESGEDDLGEAALFVTGRFDRLPPGDALIDAIARMRARLRDTGESRFPYFQADGRLT